MKKIISVLVVLGFVCMFTMPGLTAQDKEFKSELGNIKDPKEARRILIGMYNAIALLATSLTDDLIAYAENGKFHQWFLEGRFATEDLVQLASNIEEALKHVEATARLLKLSDKDGRIPVMVGQSRKENESYQGTMEDVKKAEKYIFEAIQLINKMAESPILELIKKDKKEK